VCAFQLRMTTMWRQSFGTDPTAGATNRKRASGVVPFAARPSRLAPPSADSDKVGCPAAGARPRSEFSVCVPDECTASTRTRATEYSRTSTGPCRRLAPMAPVYCLNTRRHPPSPKIWQKELLVTTSACQQLDQSLLIASGGVNLYRKFATFAVFSQRGRAFCIVLCHYIVSK
jgi:hypothetical protein